MNREATYALMQGRPRVRTTKWRAALAGHYWTIVPSLQSSILRRGETAVRPFRTTLEDPLLGPVRLTGLLQHAHESDTLVLIVHGLSGNAESPYCAEAARAAREHGYATLRLSMRGADLSGEDFFHGGLTEDLRAALASPELARYRHVLLFGYSVGGHIALRAALDGVDPRVRAVAAICPPLDLDAATIAFDHPARSFYRRLICAGLDRSYALTARRRKVPTPPEVVAAARSSRERDALTVVPRFGFADVEDYYARASVAADIHRLALPSLVVANERDPIIPADTLLPAIADASPALTVRWVARGGHIYFPADLDLGEDGPLGLEPQVVRWLGRQLSRSRSSAAVAA